MNVVRYSADAIRKLIEQDKLYRFYRSRAWRNLSHAVIAENNNECFFCKRSGKYSPAIETHHIMHVRDYPELAYSRFYHGTGITSIWFLFAMIVTCSNTEKNLVVRKNSSPLNAGNAPPVKK